MTKTGSAAKEYYLLFRSLDILVADLLCHNCFSLFSPLLVVDGNRVKGSMWISIHLCSFICMEYGEQE